MSKELKRREFLKFLLTSGFVLTGTGSIGSLLTGCSKGEEVVVETVYDFLEQLDEAEIVTPKKEFVDQTSFTVAGETRTVLFEHPDSQVTFKDVPIYENAHLSFGIGINEPAWDKKGDGVLFQIILIDEQSKENLVYSRYIDPKENLDEKRWFDEEVALKSFEGQKVTFTFKTTAGAKGDRAFDWSGWSKPQIISEGTKRRIKRSECDNIILITVDTLRADHLGCYNYSQIQTPTFDKLASEGVVCRNAFSQTHITSPSHVSILTSLYLKDHQVVSNSRYELNPSIVNMAEILKRNGYATAAAVSVVVLTPNLIKGIDRGFDRFFYSSKNEIIAGEANEYALRWLENNYHRKFFFWLHYFDPHMPYAPPPPYDTLYYKGDPREQIHNTMKKVIFHKDFYAKKYLRLIDWLLGVKDFRYPISQYDGEISYVDSQIGELMAFLQKFGLDRKTLIVLTSDHGECLGEHNIFFDHQGLYDPSVHIPLIFWYPEKISHKGVEALVASVDIMPTIFDIVGVASPQEIRGRSIVPIIGGQLSEINPEIYAEYMNHHQIMLRTQEWKFIKSLSNMGYHEKFSIKQNNEELYEIKGDPGELHNVSNKFPEVASEFRKKTDNWLRDKKYGSIPAKRAIDEESREKLRSLGYVGD